jgi:hypothetical protein
VDTCGDYGLPANICEALTNIQNAYVAYESGDVAAARERVSIGRALIAAYKSSARIHRYALTDQDRFDLSRL